MLPIDSRNAFVLRLLLTFFQVAHVIGLLRPTLRVNYLVFIENLSLRARVIGRMDDYFALV